MRFKYTAPINGWASQGRKTIMATAAYYFKPEYPPKKTTSMADLRWWRDCQRHNKRQHRNAVGIIRAFGATNFFRGCYLGSEND